MIMGLALVLTASALGCRTSKPDLKPAPQPEVLTVPPKEVRFEKSAYPDLCFRDFHNQFRKPADNMNNPILPTRGPGSMGAMSPGAMGGIR